MGEWQPIETAPKDGRDILAWCSGYHVATWFDCWRYDSRHPEAEHDGGWVIGGGYVIKPTAWQPLPAPPASERDLTKMEASNG